MGTTTKPTPTPKTTTTTKPTPTPKTTTTTTTVEKDPKDVCLKYNGILHKHRDVCCNKKCEKWGGVQGNCGKLTDKKGKVLGSNQCCGKRIEESGKACGRDGRKAPCKLTLR